MSYKVTITEVITEEKIVQGDWTVVAEKEVLREPDFTRNQHEPKTRIESVRGYAPDIKKQVTRERSVLVQEVEKLDLVAVIRAVNGIPSPS